MEKFCEKKSSEKINYFTLNRGQPPIILNFIFLPLVPRRKRNPLLPPQRQVGQLQPLHGLSPHDRPTAGHRRDHVDHLLLRVHHQPNRAQPRCDSFRLLQVMFF